MDLWTLCARLKTTLCWNNVWRSDEALVVVSVDDEFVTVNLNYHSIQRVEEQCDMEIIREHQPMLRLLAKIPSRIHKGVIGYDLNLTCIASHPHFIAIGTNAGLVYWYDRKKDTLSRLWCQDRRTAITRVSILDTVDLMVAAGSASGCLSIFQVPKPFDQDVELSAELAEIRDTLMEPELFTIPHSHTNPITALEWSQNGMKLFAGDTAGRVSLSEIDYVSKSTTSRPLLCEEANAEIVQLSYSKPSLLVSTTERTFVLTRDEAPKCIGSKPRKYKGHFGGLCLPPRTRGQLDLLVVRPKNTVYQAMMKENEDEPKVNSTILLSSLLSRPHSDIPLRSPVIFSQSAENALVEDIEKIKLIKLDGEEDAIVGYNRSAFHLINPSVPKILASCSGLRSITDLCVTSNSRTKTEADEIFVLEGHRNIVRLSKTPDSLESILNPDTNPIVESTEGTGLETVSNNILSISDSLVNLLPSLDSASGTLTSLGQRFGVITRQESVGPAYEALAVAEAAEDIERFKDIPEDNAEVIVTQPQASADPESELHDPDSDVVSNLRLELCSPYDPASEDITESLEAKLIEKLQLEEYLNRPQSAVSRSSESVPNSVDSPSIESIKTEKSLAYGPPSENSMASVQSAHVVEGSKAETPSPAHISPFQSSSKALKQEEQVESLAGNKNWFKTKIVTSCSSALVHLNNVYVIDNHGDVFLGRISPKLVTWTKFNFQADHLTISPDGSHIWRLFGTKLFCGTLTQKNDTNIRWIEIGSGVCLLDINDFSAVIALDSNPTEILIFPSLDGLSMNVKNAKAVAGPGQDESVVQLATTNELLIVSTSDGKLFGRVGVSRHNPLGTTWMALESFKSQVENLCLTQQLVITKMVHKLLVLTRNGSLFYIHGTADDLLFDKTLKWIEINTQGMVSGINLKLKPILSENGIFFWSENDFFSNTTAFEGVFWENLDLLLPDSRLKSLRANSIFKNEGILWTAVYSMKPGAHLELAFSRFHDRKLRKIQLPKKFHLKELSSAPEALWILSNEGHIYMRGGITPSSPEGVCWKKLDLTQLKDTTIVSLSLSSDSAWAVDKDGGAWMRLGPLKPEQCRDALPVWLPVENSICTAQPKLEHIAVSTSLHIVWALDSNRRVYVRQGIFPELRLGLDWMLVDGLEDVSAISASENCLWALTASGQIFKRLGIDSKNFVGDTWQRVPTDESVMTDLSVSTCDNAFALDKAGHVLRLRRTMISLSIPKVKEFSRQMPEVTQDNIDGGWAVVD